MTNHRSTFFPFRRPATGIVIVGEVGFENEVNREVEAVIADPTYDELQVIEARTQFPNPGLTNSDREVTITVSRPATETYPGLPGVLADRIEEGTDTPVTVEIEYIEKGRSHRS